MKPSRDIARLIEIMAALRDPESGCPWDQEQSFATIAPYTVEEAHEVADAIARGSLADLREELGDLLLQVVYHARMAEEAGAFAFSDVVEGITEKMIRRHPHVFGSEEARAAGAAKDFWEKAKAEEKRAKGAGGMILGGHLLEDVPSGIPPMMRAIRLQRKASAVGFDWSDPKAVISKLREETDEIVGELERAPSDRERLEDEIGDLLFTVANLARHLDIDADQALRRTNAKFIERFGRIESVLADTGRTPVETSLEEMEALWQDAKRDAGEGRDRL